MCIVGLGPRPLLTATVKLHLPVVLILLHLCDKKLQLCAVFCLLTILSPEKQGGELRDSPEQCFSRPILLFAFTLRFPMDTFLFSRIL